MVTMKTINIKIHIFRFGRLHSNTLNNHNNNNVMHLKYKLCEPFKVTMLP